jgi:hypothetical protein
MSQRREGPPGAERNGGGAANNPLLKMRQELDQAERDGKPDAFAGIYGRGNSDQQRQILKYLLAKNNEFSEKACAAYLEEKANARTPEELEVLDNLLAGVTARTRVVFEETLYDVSGIGSLLLEGRPTVDIAGFGSLLAAMDKSMTTAQGRPDPKVREIFDQLRAGRNGEQESLRPVIRRVYGVNIRQAVRSQFTEGSTTNFDRFADTLMTAGAGIVDQETIDEIKALKILHYASKEAIEQFNRSTGYQSTAADQAPDASQVVVLLNLRFPVRRRGADGKVVMEERRAADLFAYVVNAMKTGNLPPGVDDSKIVNIDSLMVALGVDPRVSFEGNVVKKLVIAMAELPSGYKKGDWRERLSDQMVADAGLFGQTVSPSRGRFGGARGIEEYTFHTLRPSMCRDDIRLSDGRAIPVRATFGGSYFDTMIGVDAVTFARLSRQDQEMLVYQLHVKGLTSYFYQLRKLKDLSIKLVTDAKDLSVDMLVALTQIKLKEMSFISEAVDQMALEAEIRKVAEDAMLEGVRKVVPELIPARFCAAERKLGLGERERNYFRALTGVTVPIETMSDRQFAHILTLELGGVDAAKLEKYNIQVGKRSASGAVEVYDFPALWAMFQNTRLLRNRPYEEVLTAWMAYANLRVVEVDVDPRNPARGKKKVLESVEGETVALGGMDVNRYREYTRIFERFINRRSGATTETDISAYETYRADDGEDDHRMVSVSRLDQLDRLVLRTIQDLVHQGENGFKGSTWEADVRRVNSKVVLHVLHNYVTYFTGFIPKGINLVTFRMLERISPRAYQWLEEFSLFSIPELIGNLGANGAHLVRMERWGDWTERGVKGAVDLVQMDKWGKPVADVAKDKVAPVMKKIVGGGASAVVWILENLGDWISIRNIPDVLTRAGFAQNHSKIHSLLTGVINFLDSPWFVPPITSGPRIDPIAFYNQVFQLYAERGIGCGVYGENADAVAKREEVRTRLLTNFKDDIVKVREYAPGIYEEIAPDHPDYAESLPDALRSRFDDRSRFVLVEHLVERPDLVCMADFTPRAAVTAGKLQADYSEENLRPMPLFYDAQLMVGLKLAVGSFPRIMRMADKILRGKDPRKYERMTPSQRRREMAEIIVDKGLYQYAADPYDMRLLLENLYIDDKLNPQEFKEFTAAFGCVGERRGNSVITGKPYFEGQVAQSSETATSAGFPDIEAHDPQAFAKREAERKKGAIDASTELVTTFAIVRIPLIGRIVSTAVDVFNRAPISVPIVATLSTPGYLLWTAMPSFGTAVAGVVGFIGACYYMVDRGDHTFNFWRNYREHMIEQNMRGAGAFFGSNQKINELIEGKTNNLDAIYASINEAVSAGKKG